ncbi:hypothetical protein I4U23_014480 [Adineta vaga]|nr:hypothetical protein I4U23_014480 [Adineta vaga]
MSSARIDAPIFKIDEIDLNNILKFIYKYENILKDYGGIKIQLNSQCQLALKEYLISPICTHIQKITKFDHPFQSIYSIEEQVNIGFDDENFLSNMSEDDFWSLLTKSNEHHSKSSISILPDESLFYRNLDQKSFSIHSLPEQSLFNVSENQSTKEYQSCLTRTHGPGSIFPLTSSRQQLPSLIYHYEGGARYYYIIPNSQRKLLNTVFTDLNFSSCLEHGEVLIDPILLDRHQIRYHRIVQNPNEFVVLAAGALSQSFTENACWNESIDFALPNWIDDNHMNYQNSLCQCKSRILTLPRAVDSKLFSHSLKNQYIQTYLNTDYRANASINPVPIHSSAIVDVVKEEPYDSLISFPSRDNGSINKHHSEQAVDDFIKQNQLQRTNESYNATGERSSPTEPMEYNSNDNILKTSSLSITTAELQNTSSIPSSITAIHAETTRRHVSRKSKSNNFNKIEIRQRTLVASGLRSSINKLELHCYFINSVKVTIKQAVSTSDKYAFIVHKTIKDALHNFAQPIDYKFLGPKCRVKYIASPPSISTVHDSQYSRIVVVRNIPQHANETDLHRLFPNCSVERFDPARSIYRKNATANMANAYKILTGFAFLLYNSAEEAANVVQQADQYGYRINDQLLKVSLNKPKESGDR